MCKGQCTPQCANKECGDDGCGGSCGACGFDKVCSAAGACVYDDQVKDGPDAGSWDPEDPGPGYDDEGDAFSAPGPDSNSTLLSSTGQCPAGMKFMYGKCVPDNQFGEDDGVPDGGCSAAGRAGPAWMLLLLLAPALRRRRRRSEAA